MAYELDRQERQRKSNGVEREVEMWSVSDKCMKIAMQWWNGAKLKYEVIKLYRSESNKCRQKDDFERKTHCITTCNN